MDIRSWLEGYRLAWEDRDADAAAALFAVDSTYRSNIFEEPYRGRDGVHAYWTEVTRTQEDVRVLMGAPFVDGEGEEYEVALLSLESIRCRDEEIVLLDGLERQLLGEEAHETLDLIPER